MSATDRRPIDSFVFCIMCRKSVSLDASNNGEVNAEAAAVHRKISVSRGGSHSRRKTTQLYGWWKPIHDSIAQPFAMMTDVGEKKKRKKVAIILRRTQMTCTFPWKSSQWFSAADLQGVSSQPGELCSTWKSHLQSKCLKKKKNRRGRDTNDLKHCPSLCNSVQIGTYCSRADSRRTFSAP